jgi:uracil-DNA glycosylase
VQELLDEMNRTVRSYHPEVGRTGASIDKLIAGTAVFLGGTGLWSGDCLGGSLPEYLPERPVMFVGHNFGNITQERHGEVESDFWKRLKGILKQTHVEPEECFFTNALMGLKPGSATGSMPSTPDYKRECREFLGKQVQIVSPRGIVALGRNARKYIEEALLVYVLGVRTSSVRLGFYASHHERRRHRSPRARNPRVPRGSR